MSWARRQGASRALLLALFLSVPVAGAFLNFFEVFVDGVGGVDGLEGARGVAASPDGRNIYVAGYAEDALAIFRTGAFGQPLTFVDFIRDNGVDVFLQGPTAVTVSPDGIRVFASAEIDNSLAVFSRDATSDDLTQIAVFQDGVGSVEGLAGASDVTGSSDGRHVYVTGRVDSALAVFTRDASTDDLSFAGHVENGVGGVSGLAGASAVAVSPDGEMVVATGELDDALVVFSRDATSDDLVYVQTLIDEVGGVDSLRSPVDVVFSGDSQDVYVAAQGDSEVSLFHRVGSTLSYVTSYPAPVTGAVAVASDGQLVVVDAVIVPEAGGPISVLHVFARDPVDGTLTLLETIENGVGGVSGLDGVLGITFSPDDSEVYTAALLDDALARFQNATVILFADGFESGDTSAWDNTTVPGGLPPP